MLKEFKKGKEKNIQLLIKKVFDEFVGYDYNDEGNRVFSEFIDPHQILARQKHGNIIITFEVGSEIAGVIEVRDNYHICLLFVDKKFQNRGIGKMLIECVIEKIKDKTNFIDVNASPNSEKFYSKLGFKKTEELREKEGIKFIPMKMDIREN